MLFAETNLFTRLLHDYLDDEEYRGLQVHRESIAPLRTWEQERRGVDLWHLERETLTACM